MGAEAAVLLPVRLETRVDEPADFTGARLRVLVVPDSCWFDRHQDASVAELELLDQAVAAAGGPLATGAPMTPQAAAAFDALAAKVGGGRALWLARSHPNVPHRPGRAEGTRVHGLPPRLELYAVVAGRGEARLLLGTTANPTTPSFRITGEQDGWWPSWSALEGAGLTFTVDLGQPPGPIAPDEIHALYVIGLGETEALDVIRPHLDAGDLGLLQPGTPTNTIAGAPAADLGADRAAWRELAERGTNGEEDVAGHALTGASGALGPLVGSSDGAADEAARWFVQALWPALRGHAVHEVWQTNDAVPAGAGEEWPRVFLRPDGHLPLLRVRDQPYGLWPVSDWDRWERADVEEPADGEPDVPFALRIRNAAAERARSGLGTVAGATSERLWDLLAQTPTSVAYEARPGVRFSTLRQFLGGPEAEAADDWLRRVLSVAGADAAVQDPLVTLAGPLPMRMNVLVPEPVDGPSGRPLFLPSPTPQPPPDGVDPAEWPSQWVSEAREAAASHPVAWLQSACRWFDRLFQPEGLDVELWRKMSSHWVELWPASLWWRLVVVSGLAALQRAVRATNPAFNTDQALLPSVVIGIPAGATGAEVDVYERFRHGIRRFLGLLESMEPDRPVDDLDRVLRGLLDTTSHRVDPWLTGVAWRRLSRLDGSRPVGLYGWVDGPLLGRPGPDMEIGVLLAPSDAQARTAVVLRDKSHFDPDDLWHLDLTSASVRDASRLADNVRTGAHPAEALGREVERVVGERGNVDKLRAAFPVRTEHAGRRTCDGLAVVDAARADPNDPRLAGAGLDAAEVARVASLASTVDAYADLLVADAAHHALAGRPEAAAQAMEAAAGLALPPPLDVLATPRTGWSITTTVLVAFPAAADLAADDGSPAAIASPAFAAWLEATVGDPGGPAWTWRIGEGAAAAEVTLAQLGLVPADAVTMHPEVLAGLATAAGSGAVTATPPGPAEVRRLAETLAARPVGALDVGLAPENARAFEASIRSELSARIDALRAAATAQAQRLRDAGTDDERRTALAGAARWGLVPAGDDLAGRAVDAAELLEERVGAAQAADPDIGISELTRLIRDLVAPGATLPLLATTTAAALSDAVGELAQEPLGPGGRPRLDATWLELVAAVRPPLARLEAHQALAVAVGREPFAASTNRPDDPWLRNVPPPSRDDRAVRRLTVVYGPGPVPDASDIAVGVLDGWAEVVPDRRHAAGAAFRFNAPGARAPQAILLAVTPVAGEELTQEGVLATVAQARATAHARTARAEDLGNLDVLSAGILPAFEDGGFQYAVPARIKDWPS